MLSNDNYKGMPREPLEHLRQFRAAHPCKYLDIAGVQWEYMVCGQGAETLLFLPGGLFVAEHVFGYIEMLESSYRVIVPSYPPIASITQIANGLTTILEAERCPSAFVLGQSFSGMVAQVYAQCCPARVKKLILTGAGPLSAARTPPIVLATLASLLAALPETTVTGFYVWLLNQLVSFPKTEAAFWKAYLKELFTQRVTKAHIVSSLRQTAEAIEKYAFDKPGATPWPGEVLILDGEKDTLSTHSLRVALAKFYPNARLQVLPGVGHTLEKPALHKYIAAVTAFLNSHPR